MFFFARFHGSMVYVYRYVDFNLEKYSQHWELASSMMDVFIYQVYSFIKCSCSPFAKSIQHRPSNLFMTTNSLLRKSWLSKPNTSTNTHEKRRFHSSPHIPSWKHSPWTFPFGTRPVFSGELLGSVTMTENPMSQLVPKIMSRRSPWLDLIPYSHASQGSTSQSLY